MELMILAVCKYSDLFVGSGLWKCGRSVSPISFVIVNVFNPVILHEEFDMYIKIY